MKYTLTFESNDLQDLRRAVIALDHQDEPQVHVPSGLFQEQVAQPREIQFGENPYHKCEECGNEFIPKRTDSRYCSKKCGNAEAYRKWYSKKKAESVDEKLKKIKKEIPIVEKQRPNIVRNL